MKNLSVAVLLLCVSAEPVLAQMIIQNQAPRPVYNGINNAFNTNNVGPAQNNMPAPSNQLQNNFQGNTRGGHIRNLAERRQEQIAKQQQQLEKSGIRIQNIPQQNSNMVIQPGNMQQYNRLNGAPMNGGTMPAPNSNGQNSNGSFNPQRN